METKQLFISYVEEYVSKNFRKVIAPLAKSRKNPDDRGLVFAYINKNDVSIKPEDFYGPFYISAPSLSQIEDEVGWVAKAEEYLKKYDPHKEVIFVIANLAQGDVIYKIIPLDSV